MKRTNFKKTLAIFLALVTMLASFSMLSIAAEEPPADTLEGEGTEASPWLIDSAADLVTISQMADDEGKVQVSNANNKVYMKVTADIDMAGVTEFKPIKMKKRNALIFDGQNHKISNITITDNVSPTSHAVGGLFQQLREKSVVENIHLVNVRIDPASDNNKRTIGGIVAYTTAPFTMKNCSISGTIYSNHAGLDNSVAGGLVGAIGESNGTGEVLIERCMNNATVENKGVFHATAGGIVGGMEYMTNYAIRYCINNGSVSTSSIQDATSGKPTQVGGIVGYAQKLTVSDEPVQVFENCVNLGDLAIADSAQFNMMGGILGVGRKPSDASENNAGLRMTNCYDYSARTFEAAFGFNGAFAGTATYSAAERIFEDCYAVNKAGSANPYTELQNNDQALSSLLVVTNSGIVDSLDAAITLSSGKTSTVTAELAIIQDAYRCEGHIYDNDCDTSCNRGCGFERAVPHAYDNECDATCNLGCGYVRTAPHTYENACQATCPGCGATRTVGDHVYTNACDAECNECGATRTVGDHVYDDDNDKFCNVCSNQRKLPAKTTTAAPATTTTAAAEEEAKKGCGGAINSTYAILALVGVLGFAFVAKKKEEN